MQLLSDTKIAGWKTVNDWNIQKVLLQNFSDIKAWETAFDEFYITRIEDRYLLPIKGIQENGGYRGEGFSIMAILCTLIEFLESSYQGVNYRHLRNRQDQLGPFEYSKSGHIFSSFLMNRFPFNQGFDQKLAENFYSNVRCGLLHEAATKGKWIINAKSMDNSIVKINTSNIIVFRDDFFNGILIYLDHYKDELLKNDQLKEAFIRKFDNLCTE